MTSTSVLVVDDDAHFRAAICLALRSAGYAVMEAADGTQALRALAALTPWLLITDIIMPDGDGIELIAAVRTTYPDLRILAISGHRLFGGVDLLNAAAMLGADTTLAKPVSAKELLKHVALLEA